jgi:UDP-N-acetylmuramoyl-L-alanyl-D-glutamate--2,6-diaminopimelate ligase
VVTDFTPNKLCYDSRFIESNDIFFAVKGFKADGNSFNDAFSKGAKAVITESDMFMADSRILHVKDVRKSMALMSAKFYGRPSQK